jgi:diguanylate cyclase (GGDEF)-like protein/PAS domain S-box-containing protein
MRCDVATDDDDRVTIRASILSRLGFFYRRHRDGYGFANQHWKEIGRTPEERMHDAWLELIHPDDRQRVEELFASHMRGDVDEFRCEYRIKAADGTWRWFVSAAIVEERGDDGKPIIIVGHDSDITDLNELREALTAANQLAEERALEAEVLRNAGAVVVASLEASTAVRSVVEQLRVLLPFDSALVCEAEHRSIELVGGSADVTEKQWSDFKEAHESTIMEVLHSKAPDLIESEEPGSPYLLFMPLVSRSTSVGVLALSRRDSSFSGEPVRIAMSMADYLALALSNARLYSRMQQRAEIDQLTGLLTRRAFLEEAEEIIDRSFHMGHHVACLMVDLDHFKRVNDDFGHAVGDQVLRTFGDIMVDTLRSSDIVGRYGGEEFCALLTDTTVDHGVEVADRLRAAVEKHGFDDVDRRVTVSVGISGIGVGSHEDRLTIEQLLKRADEALYNAKRRGRNRVVRAGAE